MNQQIQIAKDPNNFVFSLNEQEKIEDKRLNQIDEPNFQKQEILIQSTEQNYGIRQAAKDKQDQNKIILKQSLQQRPISFSNVNFVTQELNTHDLSGISFRDLDINRDINQKNVIREQSSQQQNLQQQQRDIVFPHNRLPYATFAPNVSFSDMQQDQIPYFQEIETKKQIIYTQKIDKLQIRDSYQSQFQKQNGKYPNQKGRFIQEYQKKGKNIRSGTVSETISKIVPENKLNENIRRNTSSNIILSSKNVSLIMDSSVNQNFLKSQQNRTNTDTISFVHLGKKMQSQAIVKKQDGKYYEITFRISDNMIQLDSNPLLVNKIVKVKIFPHNQEVKKHALIKIVARFSKYPIIFGVKRTKYGDYPLSFYTFSKIIIKRLKQFGVHHTTDWQLSQKKPNVFLVPNISINRKKEEKQKNQTNHQGGQEYFKTGFKKEKKIQKQIKRKQIGDKQKLKVQKEVQKSNRSITSPQNTGQFQFCVTKQQSNHHQFKLRPAKTYIHGIIYKKSKYLSRWQRRYVIVNELGVYSYHNQSESNFSIAILSQKIKQLWTNFGILFEQKIKIKKMKDNREVQQWEYKTAQLYEPKQIFKAIEKIQDHLKDEQKLFRIYLIIKIKHIYGQKVQFAIPVCNFDAESQVKNWLYAFFKALPSNKK